MATKQTKQEKGIETTGKQAPASAGVAVPSKITSLIRYVEDARTELGKVSWPTKKEVRTTSLAVLFLVVVMSIFLGLVDFLFAGLMQVILGIGG
jgi:preprotein translocase subunit SecE